MKNYIITSANEIAILYIASNMHECCSGGTPDAYKGKSLLRQLESD
jgi:hypothetical protein